MDRQHTVVVTGASTGIGYAIAKLFRERNWQVFGSVRNAADGERLRAELGVVPLLFDVTDDAAVQQAAAHVSEALDGYTLDGLVNNAGVAVGGPMLYLPMEKLRQQFEINVIGPARVTQAFAPLLGADTARKGKPGRIVQMSSVVGKTGPPFMGAYVASKHALEGMSETLRRELMIFGIDVLVIGPGAIVTPIWQKAESSGMEVYDSTVYGPALKKFSEAFLKMGRKGLPAERVAQDTWHALTARKPKLRYAPVPNKFGTWTLPKLIPNRWVDKAMAKFLGLRRR
ncbi:MAG: SDR family oxidoreductase [Janthinobacterium lividum]